MSCSQTVSPGPLAPTSPYPRWERVVAREYLLDPRRAISESGVMCLLCGRSFRHLTNTHLRGHGLTSDEYKQHFGYNQRRALMILPVRRAHADSARRSGLAQRIRRRPRLDLELRRMGGRHPQRPRGAPHAPGAPPPWLGGRRAAGRSRPVCPAVGLTRRGTAAEDPADHDIP